jgi:hypothetical protein
MDQYRAFRKRSKQSYAFEEQILLILWYHLDKKREILIFHTVEVPYVRNTGHPSSSPRLLPYSMQA